MSSMGYIHVHLKGKHPDLRQPHDSSIQTPPCSRKDIEGSPTCIFRRSITAPVFFGALLVRIEIHEVYVSLMIFFHLVILMRSDHHTTTYI